MLLILGVLLIVVEGGLLILGVISEGPKILLLMLNPLDFVISILPLLVGVMMLRVFRLRKDSPQPNLPLKIGVNLYLIGLFIILCIFVGWLLEEFFHINVSQGSFLPIAVGFFAALFFLSGSIFIFLGWRKEEKLHALY